MLNWIIDFSLRHRLLVILGVAVFAVVGGIALRKIDIDAFPDTTPVQVQINTVAASLGPEEVEQRITFPIEQAIGGLPGLEGMRSVSKFGFSQVVVTFKDGTDIYFARQLVNERLSTVELSSEIERPKMGPVSTGLGEVLHYVVTGAGNDVTELRTIHDWLIKPKMRTVKGAAEINSWGGYEKQYQVRIDPNLLIKYNLTFDEVVRAVEENNRNVGAGNRADHKRGTNQGHRHYRAAWRADSRERCGRGGDRLGDSSRGRDGRWQGRGRHGAGLHAHG
jgi:cobalt-zinc-cadmium resistance protein CzcA